MALITFTHPDATAKTVDAPTDWTLMEIAKREDVRGIVAECGGGAICGTCHVIVEPAVFAKLPEPEATELAMLELVPEREACSRLSCQIVVNEELDGACIRVPSCQLQM